MGWGGGNFISLSLVLVVVFIILTIIILALITSLLMKQKTTVLKTSSEVTGVCAEPVLSKIPFPLYFDPLPKATPPNKNGEKSSKASSEKDKKESSGTSAQLVVRKKTSFLKKVVTFLKELAPPDEPSYADMLLDYQRRMYETSTTSKHSKKQKKLASKAQKVGFGSIFQEMTQEDVNKIDVIILENSGNQELLGELTENLGGWLRNKIDCLACKGVFSPESDGNCLFGAFERSMKKNGCEVPSSHQLRLDATVFVKSEFIKNDVMLVLLLNDFLECMGSVNTFLEEEEIKKETICEKVSCMITNVSMNLVHLNTESYNNVTAMLTTSSKKDFDGSSFLVDFVNMHANLGVFCGPAMIYALARLYNITIILYTDPPLTERKLALEGNLSEKCFLCMTQDNSMACTGPSWKKNMMVFNPEAKSEKPLCLGLLINHFVSLDMQEMK